MSRVIARQSATDAEALTYGNLLPIVGMMMIALVVGTAAIGSRSLTARHHPAGFSFRPSLEVFKCAPSLVSCAFCVSALEWPPNDDIRARAERVAAVQALLEEISARRRPDDNADGLPEDLARAVDRWMDARDGHHG